MCVPRSQSDTVSSLCVYFFVLFFQSVIVIPLAQSVIAVMTQDFVYVRRAQQGPSVRSVYPAICGTVAANVSRNSNLSSRHLHLFLSLSLSLFSVWFLSFGWNNVLHMRRTALLPWWIHSSSHKPTQHTKLYDLITAHVLHSFRQGPPLLCGTKREKSTIRMHAAQLFHHSAMSHTNKTTAESILTAWQAACDVFEYQPPMPDHSRTMSPNTNILLKENTAPFQFQPIYYCLTFVLPLVILQHMPTVPLLLQMSPIFHSSNAIYKPAGSCDKVQNS